MPLGFIAGGLLFLYNFWQKEGAGMESHDLGDILLMLLDDDLFPQGAEAAESEK